MRRSLKVILWALPLSGIVLGYAWAYIFFHGLSATWQLVGQPGEAIVRIIGSKEGRKLLVATEMGKLFSFGFREGEEVALPPQLSWDKEGVGTVDKVSPFQYYGADFYTLPPLFQVKQIYELEYLYRVEGKAAVKFALAADGNLWMWHHQIAGLTGAVFTYFPVMGFMAGALVSLFIIGVNRLKRKNRFNQRELLSP